MYLAGSVRCTRSDGVDRRQYRYEANGVGKFGQAAHANRGHIENARAHDSIAFATCAGSSACSQWPAAITVRDAFLS